MKTYVLTTGGHGDYRLIGVFTGPEGVNLEALAKRWAEEHPDKTKHLDSGYSGPTYFDAAHFMQYVIEKGGLAKVESEELWLPDYSLDMRRLVRGEK